MMTTTNSTPFWLDIKKEYIDDNLNKVKEYLEKTSDEKTDRFYETTIVLLRQRIEELLSDISVFPLYKEEPDPKELQKNLKLLAIYLLADGDHDLAQTAYVSFMYLLNLYNPRFSNAIAKTIRQRLCHEKVIHPGFTWSDLKDLGGDVFIHNVCVYAQFANPLSKPLYFENFGTAYLNRDGLYITHENLKTTRSTLSTGADSIDTGIGIRLRTTNAQKLKTSLCNNIVGMDEFIKDFIQEQRKVKGANKGKTPTLQKKIYFDDEETLVRITSIEYNGTIHVETVDPQHVCLEGRIQFTMPSVLYYYTSTLHRSLHPGDCLKATITDANNGIFNIEKQLLDYFIRSTQNYLKDEGSQATFLCRLIDERPQQYVWLNHWGVAMYSANTGEFSRGDFAELVVTYFGEGKGYGMINAQIQNASDENFDEFSIRNDCLRDYAEEETAPAQTVEETKIEHLSPILLRIILRFVFSHQKAQLKASERFAHLALAHVIAELVNDQLSASYISFASTYLRVLVQFVSNQDISGIQLHPDEEYKEANSTLIRLSILQLLKEYGKKDDSKILSDTIEYFKEKQPILSNLAKLIQTSNSMQGILSQAALNVIRREIIKTLSLETENDADLEAENGSYLGIESGTQEFKTSMVYPPNNQMQPDEFSQNRNVLRAMCAFLNSTTGGTLYMGVNDQGYVTGIAHDMDFLSLSSIDNYMRYIQDTAIRHFGIDASPYLHIEPLFDNTVVAIHVEPHPYRVVELDGTAYIRVNAESREMPEQVRLELIARKVFKDKNRAAAISQLQHACSQKKCVILHNYASSHTGKVSDRLVEAYNILPDDNLVICYDCDKKDIRVFNLNRIGYTETLEDRPWKHAAAHRPVLVDVFHMTGTTPISISLQLDLLAKNLLVEEYPRAKDQLHSLKDDENVWYFDTKVYRLEGIGRFYLGLANHIKILDAPELKEYVEQFKNSYL